MTFISSAAVQNSTLVEAIYDDLTGRSLHHHLLFFGSCAGATAICGKEDGEYRRVRLYRSAPAARFRKILGLVVMRAAYGSWYDGGGGQ